jgi:DNA recombination protein RmuC
MEWIALVAGLAVGSGLGFWFARASFEKIQAVLKDREISFQNNFNEAKLQIAEKEGIIIELNKELSGLKANWKNLQDKLTEQKTEIQQLQQKFSIEFKNLANEILEEKTKKFTEQNKTNLDELLKPLGERIKDFEKKVNEVYINEAKERFSLKDEVKRLAELNQQISKEANNLTRALKGETKTQGNWGEMILESILEKSGLARDREYFIQASFTDPDGRRQQPDAIVKYPGERTVVIDSKVSLVAYERFASSETEEDRSTAAAEHLNSVKKHIQELSQKNYQHLYNIQSLDFVMMFMPVEPAYFLAIQSDSNLWSYAYDRRILLMSPTNLIAALKMVESMWRQENQNRNAIEIARQSGELFDKFAGFLEDFQDLGKRIEATSRTYDDSMKKLYTGKGNLIRRAQSIRELGAKTSKNIPLVFLDKTDEAEGSTELNKNIEQ